MTKRYLQELDTFYGNVIPEEEGMIVGYASIIKAHNLKVPIPDRLSLISKRTKKYQKGKWNIYSKSYKPENNLYKQLSFALKYEGVQLIIFKKLFEKIESFKIIEIVNEDPEGIYARKIWFLYEWLLNTRLDIEDAVSKMRYVDLADSKLQYTVNTPIKHKRQRINFNLLGNIGYCPTIIKTSKLENLIKKDLKSQIAIYQEGISPQLLRRAYGFLLLKETKSSYNIEGEKPPKNQKAKFFNDAVKQAGKNILDKKELVRLQELIVDSRKVRYQMGFRKEGGFIGEHDPETNEPLPEHISCKQEDIEQLIEGLLKTNTKLVDSNLSPVLAAALISFGFVFMHPFVDGNGRTHRYLIHHVLGEMNYSNSKWIFPISSAIEKDLNKYLTTLEHFSRPLLDFTEYEVTAKHNVNVTNDTMDYFRYFDCTQQAIYLFKCIEDTIEKIIPNEINYLKQFDTFKEAIEENLEIPDSKVKLLANLLSNNTDNKLSKKKWESQFQLLSKEDVKLIERIYKESFKVD